jgi:hypothetical protein
MTKIHASIDIKKIIIMVKQYHDDIVMLQKGKSYPENLILPLNQDALRNQLDKFEYRIAEILRKDVKSKQFC